jgi:hypothetical protein
VKKPILAFAGVITIGAMMDFWAFPAEMHFLGMHPVVYWSLVVLVASLAAFAVRKPSAWNAARGEFLCDSCKYNDSRYCSRPERPNAARCPDFKTQG